MQFFFCYWLIWVLCYNIPSVTLIYFIIQFTDCGVSLFAHKIIMNQNSFTTLLLNGKFIRRHSVFVELIPTTYGSLFSKLHTKFSSFKHTHTRMHARLLLFIFHWLNTIFIFCYLISNTCFRIKSRWMFQTLHHTCDTEYKVKDLCKKNIDSALILLLLTFVYFLYQCWLLWFVKQMFYSYYRKFSLVTAVW